MKKKTGKSVVDMITSIILIPFKFIKDVFLGFIVCCYYVYQVIKNIFKAFHYDVTGFVVLSYFIYKFFKYIIYGALFPFVLIVRAFSSMIESITKYNANKKAVKERKDLARKQAKARAIAEKRRRAEANKRRKIEASEKKRKEKEKNEYYNDKVKRPQQTLGERINDLILKIVAIPQNLQKKLKNSLENSTLAKNRRNRKDINRQALLINFEGEDAVKSEKKHLYEYVGKNAEGKVVKDYFAAYSKVEVHSFLLSEGYEVYSIRTNKWIEFLHAKSSTTDVRIKTKDLIFFLTQLSTYIKSGIPLVESLKILTRQYKNRGYKRVFRSMIYDLTMGNAFPRLLINMVKASEMTGELPEALDDMADYYTETDKTRKQMITAMMYPSMIFVFAMAVITFILVWVVPQFVEIYKEMDADQIPAFTVLVMNVSYFLKDNIIWILIGIIIFILIMMYLYRNVKVIRIAMQWTMMHMPVFGNVIIYNEVTMFTKTFSSLLKHNVFITDSMEILNKVTNNEIYKSLILDTITNLAKGEKISVAFQGHWAFPIPAYEMLVTGEKTGQLPEMMSKVSAYYQEQHRNAVARIKTFIEPVLLIFLTGMVGIIILAVIIPMFGMYSAIQQQY